MSESDAIQSIQTPNTVESLTQELCALGVDKGDTLMVHTAMSKLGWVCGGEVALIQALMAAVGEKGTLCMPTHSGALSDPAAWQFPPVPKEWVDTIRSTMPAYDPVTTPTRLMGAVPECLRRWPGALRSGHPQTSVAAYGEHAFQIVAEHPLSPQFGDASPYGALYRLNAKILLIGVGYDRCTLLHVAETRAQKQKTERLGAPVMIGGRREWVWFTDIEVDSDRFPQLGEAYEAQGGTVCKGKLGNADCRLLPSRELLDYGVVWLNEYAGKNE